MELWQVDAVPLKKVFVWCVWHQRDPVVVGEDDKDFRSKSTEICDWDRNFVAEVDLSMLYEILMVCCSVECYKYCAIKSVIGSELS